MRTKVGLWIDRQRAVIVSISQKGEERRIIRSDMEKYFHPANGNYSNSDFGRKDFPAYDIIERDLQMHVHRFYDRVISFIRNADSIFIFGPGEAKTGLRKRIEENKFMTRHVQVEAADKMVYNEIVEKVRDHYMAREANGAGYGEYAQPAND